MKMLTGPQKDAVYRTTKANCTLLQARVEGPTAAATPPAEAAGTVEAAPAPAPMHSEDLAFELFASLRPDAPALDAD